MQFVTTLEELRQAFEPTHEVALKKELECLDAHAKRFLARTPFVLIGSQDGAGHADVSPKGDMPGFVHVLDDQTIAIPDRPGNNRLDTWENIVQNPAVGLIFLIPGMNESLRINGQARLTLDKELCGRMHVNNRSAKAVLLVKIEEVYMHCAKAFMRSKLWSPDSWQDRSDMPSLGRMLRDQAELAQSPQELDASLDEAYKSSLW